MHSSYLGSSSLGGGCRFFSFSDLARRILSDLGSGGLGCVKYLNDLSSDGIENRLPQIENPSYVFSISGTEV